MTNTLALEHIQQSLRIPVVDGMYAQGDLLVIPLSMLPDVRMGPDTQWPYVPPEGVEVLRGPAGGNPHTLVAEPGICRWTRWVGDPEGLALGAFTTTAVAYLMHPEHGATGSAPGAYLIRRQREFGSWGSRLVAD